MLRTFRRRRAFRRAFDRSIGRWLAIAADAQRGDCPWPTVTFSRDLDPRIEIAVGVTANILAVLVEYPSAKPGELCIRIGRIRVIHDGAKRGTEYPPLEWWMQRDVAIAIGDRRR